MGQKLAKHIKRFTVRNIEKNPNTHPKNQFGHPFPWTPLHQLSWYQHVPTCTNCVTPLFSDPRNKMKSRSSTAAIPTMMLRGQPKSRKSVSTAWAWHGELPAQDIPIAQPTAKRRGRVMALVFFWRGCTQDSHDNTWGRRSRETKSLTRSSKRREPWNRTQSSSRGAANPTWNKFIKNHLGSGEAQKWDQKTIVTPKSLIVCFRSWNLHPMNPTILQWGWASCGSQWLCPMACDHQGALTSQHRDSRQGIGRRAHLGGDDDLRRRMDHFAQGTKGHMVIIDHIVPKGITKITSTHTHTHTHTHIYIYIRICIWYIFIYYEPRMAMVASCPGWVHVCPVAALRPGMCTTWAKAPLKGRVSLARMFKHPSWLMCQIPKNHMDLTWCNPGCCALGEFWSDACRMWRELRKSWHQHLAKGPLATLYSLRRLMPSALCVCLGIINSGRSRVIRSM